MPSGWDSKTAAKWDVVGENDTASLTYSALYDNIVVTDGNGTEKKVLFRSSSDSNANAVDINAASTGTMTFQTVSGFGETKIDLSPYFNNDSFSFDTNRSDGNLDGTGLSYLPIWLIRASPLMEQISH